ncbi:Ni/Fe hydrogenase subunit alpha, partial [archaeon]
AFHWARLIEILDASERMLELLSDDTIIGGDILNTEGEYVGEGVGVVEAPRGLLIHHYIADENGLVKNANIIVATTCNMAAINLSVKNAAKRYIKEGKISDKVLNMVEIAFRAYDPCLACATHSLPGLMNISLTIYDSEGNVVKRLRK